MPNTPSKSGYSLERFQMLRQLCPITTSSAADLKSAAATNQGKVYVPAAVGSYTLKFLGIVASAAGGAQTTAGTLKLQIDGVDVTDNAGNPFLVGSVASHSEGSVVETELNKNVSGDLNAPPSYPTITAGSILSWVQATQGVGAGSQSYYPYVLFSDAPAT